MFGSDYDEMDIGPTPTGEECVQAGAPDYYEKNKAETKRFIELLRKVFGPEPEGARLKVKANQHDFGTYHEVVCKYDMNNAEATAYAFACEGMTPEYWTDDQPVDWRSKYLKKETADAEG